MVEEATHNNSQPQQPSSTGNALVAKVEFRNVSIIFGAKGPAYERALSMLDAGATRAEIAEETGCVLGVANANLKVADGEISVLMGLSGSGKSTLLRCLNGLNPVSRGEVLLRESGRTDATCVNTCDAATLQRVRRHSVAMVFQQFALLPWRTVEQNVGLGLELRGVSEAQRKPTVAKTLEMVGLSEWANHLPSQLSGGMQQRVGLARAFVTDADVLLMDEPFSALDPLIREHLQNELLHLQKTFKKTIVFVSHDLDEAMKLGQHISIMEGGRIVQHGSPEQIVLNPSNDYVREFVAHMNPSKVLRGASLMRPLSALPTGQDQGLPLDQTGQHYLQLGPSLQEHTVYSNGHKAQAVSYEDWSKNRQDPKTINPESPTVFFAPMDVLLEDIIQMRHISGAPVVLCDEQGDVAGVVSDSEIYTGLLRQGHAQNNGQNGDQASASSTS